MEHQAQRIAEHAVTEGVVTSADGTTIAYSMLGSGPALVMVHCVGASRATTPQPGLPAALADHFTVVTYDRRGKGRSGNTQPYAVEREFEDLSAVLDVVGGSAVLYGFSSGATLSLLAARAGLPITQLALLEPPLFAEPDPEHRLAAEGRRRVEEDLAAAHRWFDVEIVGVPEEVLAQMPPLTGESLSNTASIVHELTFLPGTSGETFAAVDVPTLVVASDSTAPVIYEFAEALRDAMPHVTYRVLPGEWHGVSDEVLTEAIVDFVGSAR